MLVTFVVVLLFSWTVSASVTYSQEALLDFVSWQNLPGTSQILSNLTFKFFAGYVELNPGNFYYYWFFESQNDPTNDPVVLWLNGGPGCAGEWHALEDNGPIRLDKDLNMFLNPYSLNLIANVIYLDQPTGTGFSYSQNKDDYQITDNLVAQNAYTFLQGWFKRFSSFQSNDFRIATQSYGGHYGAVISYEILTRQQTLAAGDIKINLKGTAVGNPVVDLFQTLVSKIDKLWGDQVIPLSWYNTWKPACSTRDLHIQNNDWCNNYETFLTSELGFDAFGWAYPYSMSFPICDAAIDAANTYQNREKLYQLQKSLALPPQVLMMPCSHSAEYLNQPNVMSLIHAVFGGFTKSWAYCNAKRDGMQYSQSDINAPVLSLYYTLAVDYGLHILVFSGTDDDMCPTESTQDWVFGLNLGIATPWQTWTANSSGYSYSGFYIQFNYNLTFLTLRNAGHVVSNYQPEAALMVMHNFLRGTWFNVSFNHASSTGTPMQLAAVSFSKSTGYTAGEMTAVFFGGLVVGLLFTGLYFKYCVKRRDGHSFAWLPMSKFKTKGKANEKGEPLR
jgi:serine carboxypeptidase-like clade 2